MEKNEVLYIEEKIVDFLAELTRDYQSRIESIAQQKSSLNEHLESLREKLTEAKSHQSDKARLFSPNNKTIDLEELLLQINQEEAKLEQLIEEQESIDKTASRLQSAAANLRRISSYTNDLGLNILESQERDRQRIARDLHDSTVQNLTGIIHKIDLCSRLMDIDPLRAKLELSVMLNNVKLIINEIREVIYNLKPMSLDDLGLSVTVERYAKQLMANHDIKVNVKSNHETEDIMSVIRLSLYRVIQEACNNVIKHAKANRIDIDINFQPNQISVLIHDDGEGFDCEKQLEALPERYSGYGLSFMRERIYLLSGNMKIQSEKSKGTTITINVPLTIYRGENNE